MMGNSKKELTSLPCGRGLQKTTNFRTESALWVGEVGSIIKTSFYHFLQSGRERHLLESGELQLREAGERPSLSRDFVALA